MSILKTYNFKKILTGAMWIAISCGCVVLLAAGVHRKNSRLCKGIEVEIKDVNNNQFIGNQDVIDVVKAFTGNKITGKPIDEFNLVEIEKALKKEIWINKAELYFDNNDMLRAEVNERQPIARVFTAGGNSFYIDDTEMMLPLSDRLSARVPVFTNFPSEAGILSKPDSNLVSDIRALSIYIQKDSFLMAMIDQVAITNQRRFEMIPKIGEQLIVFGEANDMEQKFNKLKLFYKKVIPRYGWARYNVINLEYNGQVVAKIRGKEDVQADSLRTMEMMKAIAAYTSKMAGDTTLNMAPDNAKNSTDISLILESFQRDEEGGNEGYEMEENVKRDTTNMKRETGIVKTEAKDVKPIQKPETKIMARDTTAKPPKKKETKAGSFETWIAKPLEKGAEIKNKMAASKPAKPAVKKTNAAPKSKPLEKKAVEKKSVEKKTVEKPKAVMKPKNEY